MERSFNQNSDLEEELNIESNQINFGSLLEILLRRKKIFILFCISFFLIATTNLVYRRIKKPIFRGSFTIMISDPFINNRTSNIGIEKLALNKESVDIPTLVQYLKSPGIVSNIAKNNNISAINLINRIKISVPRNEGGLGSYLSKTLLISLDGENKVKMQKILDELSEQYIVNASESRNERLSDGIKFLNSEKPKLLDRVQEAQKKLEKFRLKNRIINPIKEGERLTKLIEQNQNKILTIKSENLRLLFIKENLVNGILFTEGISNGGTSASPAGLGIIGSDQLLLQEILNIKAELANAQSKYKKSSTVVRNLKEKLSKLEPILLKNQKSAVEAAIIVNNSQIKSHENQLLELKKKFISIPGKVTNYSVIIEELRSLEKNLQSLNETRDKLELDLSQGTLPWKIINYPFVNPNPIKPQIQRNLIYIIISTLVFGTLITYLVEKFDDVFHNPKEVEKFINLPILGFVPFFDLQKKNSNENESKEEGSFLKVLLDDQQTDSFRNIKFIFEETFRNIYTSIKFSKSDKDIKIINITSTIPEEGKSLCSLSLAINIAQISKKVLIIDTDLRKPTLHKRLGADNVIGISNYLVDDDTDWEKYISKYNSIENLYYITAGKIPPNSIRLLESNKMNSFLEELRKSNKFEFVILDCPPLLGLSDALIVSNYVDATILTVSLNKVNKKLSAECLEKLNLIEKPVIGTIINSVTKEINNNFLSNKYYSYGNRYNYYSYKYMPQEIQNRYMNNYDKKIPIKDKFKDLFINTTLLEKLNLIFKKFMKWLNE